MAIRRISRVRTEVAPEEKAKQLRLMKEKVKSIAEKQIEINRLTALVAGETTELMRAMKAGKLSHVETSVALVDIVRSAGKSSNVIDVKAFFKKVGGATDDFFAAVSIGVTKAKDILGQKELDKITKTTPGTPGEEKLKVTIR